MADSSDYFDVDKKIAITAAMESKEKVAAAGAIAAIADTSQATAEDCATKINEIITALKG